MKIISKISGDDKKYFENLKKRRENKLDTLKKSEFKGFLENQNGGTDNLIVELVQNAEDTGANEVNFILTEKALIFWHSGENHFSISDAEKEKEDREKGKLGDLNAITNICRSNKINDEGKIGRFGIGLMSSTKYSDKIFIYDHSSKVHSWFFSLSESLYVPDFYNVDEKGKITDLKGNELKDDKRVAKYINDINGVLSDIEENNDVTLFYFPLQKNVKESFNDIKEKLERQNRLLLFLQNVAVMNCRISGENGVCYSYKRESDKGESGKSFDKFRRVDLICTKEDSEGSKDNLEEPKESFLVFDEEVDEKNESNKLSYSVAYLLDHDNDEKLVPINGGTYAYCFFETKEPTGLHFLINAPFVLNSTRENFSDNNDSNKELLKSLAGLAVTSLMELKEKKMLTADILDILPTDENTHQNTSIYYEFYKTILEFFKKEEILPTDTGDYTDSEHAYWIEPHPLMDDILIYEMQQQKRLYEKSRVFAGQEKHREYIDKIVNCRAAIAVVDDKYVVQITENKDGIEEVDSFEIGSSYRLIDTEDTDYADDLMAVLNKKGPDRNKAKDKSQDLWNKLSENLGNGLKESDKLISRKWLLADDNETWVLPRGYDAHKLSELYKSDNDTVRFRAVCDYLNMDTTILEQGVWLNRFLSCINEGSDKITPQVEKYPVKSDILHETFYSGELNKSETALHIYSALLAVERGLKKLEELEDKNKKIGILSSSREEIHLVKDIITALSVGKNIKALHVGKDIKGLVQQVDAKEQGKTEDMTDYAALIVLLPEPDGSVIGENGPEEYKYTGTVPLTILVPETCRKKILSNQSLENPQNKKEDKEKLKDIDKEITVDKEKIWNIISSEDLECSEDLKTKYRIKKSDKGLDIFIYQQKE